MGSEENQYELHKGKLLGNKWIARLVIFYFCIVAFSAFLDNSVKIWAFFHDRIVVLFLGEKFNDNDLISRSRKLANDIIKHNQDIRKEPPAFDNHNWEVSMAAWDKFDKEYTRQVVFDYMSNFEPQVAEIRLEFLKRKLTDKNLENSYDRVVNPLDVHYIAVSLNELAARLETGFASSTTGK